MVGDIAMSSRDGKERPRSLRTPDSALPKGLRNAIITLSTAVGREVLWAVDGSTALALQGVDLVPEDLDVLTDIEGAYAIARRLEKFVVKPVSFGETDRYSSHFGVFSIGGIRVEVMGNLRVFRSGKWTKVQNPNSMKLRRVAVGGETVSVVSLDSLRQTGYLKERLRRGRAD